MARNRLDVELVRRNLAASRTAAKELVDSKRVLVSKMLATKPATQVETAVPIEVLNPKGEKEYVSRGAHKLAGALEAFEGKCPDIEGTKCLDVGASTGGFTDVLLRRGASEVTCVDVGYGQLAWSIQNDPRVKVLDRTNVRYLTPNQLGTSPDIVVADLSFISLTLVLPALIECCPNATMILMVKPQFEAGKGRVGARGVVKDLSVREETVNKVADAAINLGMNVVSVAPSPLPGPSGNVEFFLLLAPRNSDGQKEESPMLKDNELREMISRAVCGGNAFNEVSNGKEKHK